MIYYKESKTEEPLLDIYTISKTFSINKSSLKRFLKKLSNPEKEYIKYKTTHLINVNTTTKIIEGIIKERLERKIKHLSKNTNNNEQ